MISNEIRTRFAPSPTGWLHIGNARTALFAYMFARKNNGKYILRIEDTDLERSSRESEIGVLEDMKWLNIDWDEGPETGGDFGPYRQSERLDIYREYAEKLVTQGKAFYCYCTEDELKEKKEKALAEGRDPHYDGTCRSLSSEQQQAFLAEGRKPVIRFKVPEKSYVVNDIVKGEVTFDKGVVGDFIIIRSNNMPTYNYAVVIDDALMKITHVIRGDDHLSNTLRQVMLFEAFGFELPEFAHLAMILGKDKSKMSKRTGEVSVKKYKELGYLPDAICNYLMLLGWNPKTENEKVTKDFVLQEFALESCSKSAAVFDINKLNFLNNQYLREQEPEELFQLLIPFLESHGYIVADQQLTFRDFSISIDRFLSILPLMIDRVSALNEVPAQYDNFYKPEFDLDTANEQIDEFLKLESTEKLYTILLDNLKEEETIKADSFKKLLKKIQKEEKIKGKNLFMPLRIALTGELHGPDLPMIAEFLGKEKCITNISKALSACKTND